MSCSTAFRKASRAGSLLEGGVKELFYIEWVGGGLRGGQP